MYFSVKVERDHPEALLSDTCGVVGYLGMEAREDNFR